jgi:hypothetical protein
MENLTTKTGGSEDYSHKLPLQNHLITGSVKNFMKKRNFNERECSN